MDLLNSLSQAGEPLVKAAVNPKGQGMGDITMLALSFPQLDEAHVPLGCEVQAEVERLKGIKQLRFGGRSKEYGEKNRKVALELEFQVSVHWLFQM